MSSLVLNYSSQKKTQNEFEYVGFNVQSEFYTLIGIQFYDPVILCLLRKGKTKTVANIQSNGLFEVLDNGKEHTVVVKAPSEINSANVLGNSIEIAGQVLLGRLERLRFGMALHGRKNVRNHGCIY